jgi:hypothetical protein
MANKNVTRVCNNMQKATRSLMTIVVDTAVSDDYQDASNNYLVGYLPPGAIITNAEVSTDVISDAATVTLGTTEGGTEILSAGSTAAVGITGTFTGKSQTGSGVPVYMALGAAATTGRFVAAIVYDELELYNGDLTKVDNI